MKCISKIACLLMSIPFYQYGSAQNAPSPSSLGIDFNLNKYKADSKLVPGVSINYSKGISSYYNYTVIFSGSFLDSARKNIKEPEKKLLLEGSASVVRKLSNPSAKLQPFALLGLGSAFYNNTYDCFIPVGIGLQSRISSDIFATVNFQYRTNILAKLNSHYFFSIGLSGVLSKRNNKKKENTVVINTPHNKRIQNIYNDTDRDHDGIVDSLDQCPDLAGLQSNKGCPAIKPHELFISKILDSLAKNILFETNSAIIKEESYSSLDEAVKILNNYPSLSLKIEGHTDNVGSENNNFILSNDRAKAVASYLNTKGILLIRLKSVGFGETHPIADNSTIEGRKVNRRVEFKVNQDPL